MQRITWVQNHACDLIRASCDSGMASSRRGQVRYVEKGRTTAAGWKTLYGYVDGHAVVRHFYSHGALAVRSNPIASPKAPM